ncbi:MAG TPA: hypothetical protein ENN75_04560, partial [candidate division Zixibacteria bacterium]|nr:hypothetical protein [candidate division Zixibacteria bacterium]
MSIKNDYKDPYWWLWALLDKWKMLIFVPVIIGVLGFGVAHFIMPKWFKAEAEIMPLYQSGNMGGAMASLITGMMSLGGGGGDYVLPMMITPSDLWGAIVKSNAIVDTLIEEYDLGTRYKQDYIEETRKVLKKRIETNVTGEGILVLGFEDKDPVFAAKVANSIVEYLDGINRELRMGTASQTRSFIEGRLKDTEVALAKAESAFVTFQKDHGAISIEDQARVAIESAAQIRAELLMAEVELSIAQSSRKPGHGGINETQSRIDELKKQLAKLETGESETDPFGIRDLPELGVEYAKLFRDYQIQELLYQYLTQQYEQARIEESRDVPILQVLSRARVPEKRDRPKRIVVSGLAFFAALILVGIWIVGSAGIDRMKEI